MVYSDQSADPVAQECSTVSDHTGSETDESIPVIYIINSWPQHLINWGNHQ